MDLSLCAILACDIKGGIGKNGRIPWYIPYDLQHFKTITSSSPLNTINVVIMGRNTWFSLPHKPLKNRINIIITSKPELIEHMQNVYCSSSLDEALKIIQNIQSQIHNVFVIGGSKLYNETFKHALCKKVYITHIFDSYDCDAFINLNIINKVYTLVREGSINNFNGVQYTFCEYLK